jgi:probable FeS assembly SUF system protein SufT
MNAGEQITLSRDVEATIVPAGDPVTLKQGEPAQLTQELGGSYTIVVNGNMFRIEHKDGDALGREVEKTTIRSASGTSMSEDELETEIWNQLKTCYDPEIPVNIVDLGLIYDCAIEPMESADGKRIDVKMTLTAPGCGMGPMIQQDVQNKLMCIEDVEEANVELVWDPQWNQGMMTEAAQLQLGLM